MTRCIHTAGRCNKLICDKESVPTVKGPEDCAHSWTPRGFVAAWTDEDFAIALRFYVTEIKDDDNPLMSSIAAERRDLNMCKHPVKS